MFLNWFLRHIFPGVLIRLFVRIHVVGLENLPKEGAYIMAIGPHRTELESVFIPVYLRKRQLHFFAKQEYWEKHRLQGKLMTAIGLLPVSRTARAMVEQIKRGGAILTSGGIVAMYPEATRNKKGDDGTMHKGYPGLGRLALESGASIIPVGLIGMSKLTRPGKKLPRPGMATIVIGEPIHPAHWPVIEKQTLTGRALENFLAPRIVDEVCREIARLSVSHYVDTKLEIVGP